MNSLSSKIENIMNNNPGKIYSIEDFYYLGSRNTIKSILYRLNQEEKISRLIDGLYVKNKFSQVLEEYSYPSQIDFANKIAEKFSWKIAPTGDLALNYTGLSSQVPNVYTFVSDGPYREYMYNNVKIIFKHTSNKNIGNYSKKMLIVIQTIKTLGEQNITSTEIRKLARYSFDLTDEINLNSSKFSFWIKNILDQIRELNNE